LHSKWQQKSRPQVSHDSTQQVLHLHDWIGSAHVWKSMCMLQRVAGMQLHLIFTSLFTQWSSRWNSVCTRYAGGLVTAGDLARARPQLKPAMRAHAYGVEVGDAPCMRLHCASGTPLNEEKGGMHAATWRPALRLQQTPSAVRVKVLSDFAADIPAAAVVSCCDHRRAAHPEWLPTAAAGRWRPRNPSSHRSASVS
jgi:hypothetical protein